MSDLGLTADQIDGLVCQVDGLVRAVDQGQMVASATMRAMLAGTRVGLLVAVGRAGLDALLPDETPPS